MDPNNVCVVHVHAYILVNMGVDSEALANNYSRSSSEGELKIENTDLG